MLYQRTASARRNFRGFTLIEIMIVVGIIVVLATIGTMTGISVKRGAQKKNTQATLHTLQALWNDYLAAGNPDIPAQISTLNPLLLYPPDSPAPPSSYPVTNSPDPPGYYYPPTYPASDVVNWVIALRSNPQSAAAINNLHMMKVYDPKGTLPGSTLDPDRAGPSNRYFYAVVDGWGNPIRYIPMYAPTSAVDPNINIITKKDGYFFSFGPDGDTARTPGLSAPAAADDLRSTDAY